MAFIVVSTSFVVYEVLNAESGVLKWVAEFKTKGEAIAWIYQTGWSEKTYYIQEHYRRK